MTRLHLVVVFQRKALGEIRIARRSEPGDPPTAVAEEPVS